MPTSKASNLTVTVKGDVSDVHRGLNQIKRNAKGLGLSIAKEITKVSKNGQDAAKTLVLAANSIKAVQSQSFFQNTGGVAQTVTKTLDSEALQREAERELKAEKAKQEAIKRLLARKEAARAVLERTRQAKRLTSSREAGKLLVAQLKSSADAEKIILTQGSKTRLGIAASTAKKIRDIHFRLAADLRIIDKQAKKGKVGGISLTEARARRTTFRNTAKGALTTIHKSSAAQLEALQQKELAKKAILLEKQKQKALALLKEKKAKENIIKAKQHGREQVTIVKETMEAEKIAILNGANTRVAIKANLAKKEKAIYRQLGRDLEKIAKGSGKRFHPITLGLQGAKARLQAQKKITRAVQEADKALRKVPNRHLSGFHRNWFRQVVEITGAYRIVNSVINSIIAGVRSIPTLGIELQTTKAVLISTLGSVAAVQGAFTFLTQEAERSGKAILGVRETFRNLNASMTFSGETSETVTQVFENLNTVSTALHLSGEKTQHVFLAIAQIFNKTKVQSEELVKQLGNLLPGAYAVFARSMKISTQELTRLLRQGLVSSDKVAGFTKQLSEDFAAAFVVASRGLQANLERMQTSFTLLGEAVFLELEDHLLGAVKLLRGLADSLKAVITSSIRFGNVFATILTPVIALLAYKVSILATIPTTFASITIAAVALKGALIAAFTNPVTIAAAALTSLYVLYKIGSQAREQEMKDAAFLLAIDEKRRDATLTRVSQAGRIEVAVKNDPTVKQLQSIVERLQEKKNNLTKGRGRNRRRLKEERIETLDNSLIIAQTELATATQVVTAEITGQIEKQKEQEALKAKSTAQTKEDGRIRKELTLLAAKARIASVQGLIRESALYRRQAEDIRVLQSLKKLGTEGEKPTQQYKEATKVRDINIVSEDEYKYQITLLTIRGDLERKSTLELGKQRQILLDTLIGTSAQIEKKREELTLAFSLQDAEKGRANIVNQTRTITTEKTKELAAIQRELSLGLIDEFVAYKRSVEARTKLLNVLQATQLKLGELAFLTPGEKMEESFNAAKQAVKELNAEIGNMKPPLSETQKLVQNVQTTATQELGSAFTGFISGAMSAKQAMISFAQSMVNALARIASQKLAEEIIGLVIETVGATVSSSSSSSSSGGGGGGGDASGAGIIMAAKGAVVSGSKNSQAQLISRPTLFPSARPVPFARGGVLAGEAGVEAILPLKRNSQGRLGVETSASASASSTQGIVIQNLSIHLEARKDETPEEQSEQIGKAIRAQLQELIDMRLRHNLRPGGVLNPTQVQASF